MCEPTDYEALCMTLHSYRFGTINFIELIERFEAELGITDEREALHFDHALDECETE